MPNETENQLATKKVPLPIGPKGIQLESFEALWRFAQCIAASPFAPRGMEKAEAIVPAIQLGLEIGLSPMSALQNVAVINGRPGIYGDAALALVRASGHCEYYKQRIEGEGDDRTAIVESKRDDSPEPIVTTFSVRDAKRAGLWGKQGPWTQYPDRMLLFRARGFNLRDNFGDILKGLHTVEELSDSAIKTVEGRVVNGDGIKFGPAIPEEHVDPNGVLVEPPEPEPLPEGMGNTMREPNIEPPKRKRRTKAEMEAARATQVPETTPAANPEHAGAQAEPAAGQTPQRATPLEGLRNLINATPITEFQLENWCRRKGFLEAHQNIANLSTDNMAEVIGNFQKIANSIADGTDIG